MSKKLTLDYVKQVCAEHGFECLSEEYIRSGEKLQLKCKEGHIFKSSYESIHSNSNCPKCSNIKKSNLFKFSLEYVKEKCKEKGFECLSEEYINNSTKLELKCKENHIFFSTYGKIKNGRGCQICGVNKNKNKNNKFNIFYVKQICLDKGFECLSEEYINVDVKLQLQCSKKHKFNSSFYNVKKGIRCPFCFYEIIGDSKRFSLDYVKNICYNKNLIFLDESYKNIYAEFEVKCMICEFNFTANFDSIKHNKICLCPQCNANNNIIKKCRSDCHPNKLNINIFKNIAISKNGICISNEYSDGNQKLKFYCNFCKKFFLATGSHIKHDNSWCPNCSESKSERICRLFMETIFNTKFNKTRPEWLKNPKTNRKLELDGYCEKLSLAFEHNGAMHYKKIKSYKMIDKDLEYANYKDQIKLEICKQNNIKLIVIPELGGKVKIKDLKSYIKEQCLLQNIALPENYDDIEIDYNQIYFK